MLDAVRRVGFGTTTFVTELGRMAVFTATMLRAALTPPGEARPDWEITIDLANRMGANWKYDEVSDVFDEFASLTENYSTLDYAKLGLGGRLVSTLPASRTGVLNDISGLGDLDA